MASGYEQCGGPVMPGRPRIDIPPGPQFCGDRIPGARGWNVSPDVTDRCGRPLPEPCVPQGRLQPTCYRLAEWPEGCVADGFVVIEIGANCTGSTGPVVDERGAPINNAIRVPGCQRDSLPSQPFVPVP